MEDKSFLHPSGDGVQPLLGGEEQAELCRTQPEGAASELPAGDTREVVEYYPPILKPTEVTRMYVQPSHVPGRSDLDKLLAGKGGHIHAKGTAKPMKSRRSRRGLWAFLACFAVVTALALGAYVLNQQWHDDEDSVDEEIDYTAEVSIDTYPYGEGVQLELLPHHEEKLSIQEVYRRVNPAVVTVLAQVDYGMSVGTGVIFTEDGYLLTNYHVVAGATGCDVTLSNGKTYEAKYVGGDSEEDIAVLKVNATGLPVAQMGDSDDLTVGDPVYAIGNPLGVELRGTLTDGIVSAINRDVDVQGRKMTLIQTNAAMNEGNSGGPLINVYGQVIGINTIKMMSFTSNIEGLGFAIPMTSVQKMANDILECGKVRPQPRLGVTVARDIRVLPDGRRGIEVLEVSVGTPADHAGVQVGDVIVSAGGENVDREFALLRIRQQFQVGDEMPVTIWRDGTYLEITLKLDQEAP